MNERIGTRVLVRNRDRYLFLKDKEGFWDLAGGGLEEGETIEECAKRELKEETGINVSVFQHLGKQDVMIHGRTFVYHGFLADTGSDDVILSEEHCEFKWLKHSEIKSLVGLKEAKSVLNVIEAIEKSKHG